MGEKVLLLSTWYPSSQEDRSWKRSWAIADIVAELQRHSVSTVAIAARPEYRKVTADYVHGQLVISVPYCLITSCSFFWEKLCHAWLDFGRQEGSGLNDVSQIEAEKSATSWAQGAMAAVIARTQWGVRVVKTLGHFALAGIGQIARPFHLAKLLEVLPESGKFERVIIHGRVAQNLTLVERFWAGPVCVCFHETDYHEPSTAGVFRKWGARIERVAFRSERLHERFVQGGLMEPSRAYLAVPSGIPEKSVKARSEYAVRTPGILKLVCVSSMIPRKNLGALIKTLSRIQTFDWSLDLYGEGPLRQELESQALGLGLNGKIRFCGFVPHDEVMGRFPAYDVFVLLSERETFGLVYIEALSQGLFVIGSEGEGIDGIVRDGWNGFLAPPKRPEVLLEKLDFINGMSVEAEADFKDRIHASARAMTLERIAGQYYHFMVKRDPTNTCPSDA